MPPAAKGAHPSGLPNINEERKEGLSSFGGPPPVAALLSLRCAPLHALRANGGAVGARLPAVGGL